MKSYCIKTNNTQIIDYLLKSLDTISLSDIYYINKKFKIYNNIIVHYVGNNESLFLSTFTNIISDCILVFYEQNLIRRIINFNYFYFDDFEKKIIEDICYNSSDDNNFKYRKEEIWISVLKYISENKSMVLDGFVNFRLENYTLTLEELINYSVNKYVLEKEYTEFINLLKIYINSKECNTDLIHLVYVNDESFLLDKNKKILNISDDLFNVKYLSDISFSSNDYTLNTLLTLLPKKIYVHVIDYEDEFINTLKHIFEDRICICKDCNICKTYRILTNSNNVK
jgi:putative sporulation protein YtxC